MRDRLIRWFVGSAVALLVVTALAKLVSLLGREPILDRPNALLQLVSNRQMLFLAAALEVFIVWLIVRQSCKWRQLGLLLWITGVFAGYRAGLWWSGYEGSCDCLGILSAALGISPRAADLVARIMLNYLAVGGAVGLCVLFMGHDKGAALESAKLAQQDKAI